MIDSEHTLRARREWVAFWLKTRDAGLTCRRFGISAPTLRKWRKRFEESGEQGLVSQSHRPHRIPETKVTPEIEAIILDLRKNRLLGPKGIRREMLRLHQFSLSTSTIWKTLHRHGISRLRPDKRPTKYKRYNRPVPGDRVQMDTCKIAKHLYQFTAIDDCTRMRVLGLYTSRSGKNAVHFLQEKVLAQFPFPVQRIQTDCGLEFLDMNFQDALRENCIKFRLNRPYSPHLNGKVERSHRTDRMEFWPTVDRAKGRPFMEEEQSAWQRFYNEERTHYSLSRTPHERFEETRHLVPTADAVRAGFDPLREGYRTNYRGARSPKAVRLMTVRERTEPST